MANIDLRRFVDINIQHHATSTVNSIRDTIVLMSTEGTSGTDKTYASLAAYLTDATEETPTTTTYATMYFNNGGNKLRIIYGISRSTLESTISGLPNEQIVVAYTGQYQDIKSVAQTRESDANVYGINQKILLGCTSTEDTDSVKNFAVKYSNVTGAEMTIAAYLSTIDIYGTDTVHDYAFTKENVKAELGDDEVLGTVLNNNMNVDMYIANATRNLGGNMKNGLDIVNEFMLIVLHQTLTDRLVNLLTEKIKGNTGLASIHAVMAQELSRYLTNGYLTTDKAWTDNDLTVSYNGATYTIIRANTALLLGYYISILPLSSLSDEDKTLRKTPPIYVVLADSYGIRQITINGEVI